MQQKTIPNYATHGNTYHSSILRPTGASHSHLHKPKEKNKRKGVATSLCASSLSATAPELVPHACTCRRPARRPARLGGVEEKDRRSVQYRDRGLIALAPGSPFLVRGRQQGRMRRLVAPKPTREPKTSARQKGSRSSEPRRRRRRSPHTRARTRPCTPFLYPAYANTWITEAWWEEPRSPIGREKRGVNLP